MFVSVIVPNYNHAKFLDQRIQSILNQTYQEFELIILDDCSPDEGASCKVIEQYRDNPHVRHIVYNEVNSGSTFRQWDKGIKLANGDLIWIAESDDFCEPTLLEMLVNEFRNNSKLTLAYTLSKKVDAEGNEIRECYYALPINERLNGYDYIKRYMTMGNHCKNASACLFKKKSYEQIDPIYTRFKATGDKMFWVEIAEKGDVAILYKRLNYFRQHSAKVTPSSSLKGINLRETRFVYEYILSRGNISNWRRKMMRVFYQDLIAKRVFESEQIRSDLMHYWGFGTKLLFVDKLMLKYITCLRRLNIYV